MYTFRGHVNRISAQLKEQKDLKENLTENHKYIHMDFAKDYKCRSQNEIQSAYWNQTLVTLHPVALYFKERSAQEKNHINFVSP